MRVLVISLVLCSGCIGASSNPYRAATAAEQKLLSQSERTVFPSDVRGNFDRYRTTNFAWTGVILDVQNDPDDKSLATVLIEHHYWDWIEDHSVQKAVAFLSPRGEGKFVCHLPSSEGMTKDSLATRMAIVYASPVAMTDGVLHMSCALRVAPPGWYATDIFDYGRNYLLNHDTKDFKILRIPME